MLLAMLAALLLQLPAPEPAPVPVAPAAPAAAHQRVLPLEGGINVRDLGGYRAADGRTVRWGLLYRSGAMNRLTPRDFDALAARGIRVVCDFRDTGERAREPVRWPANAAPVVHTDEYDMTAESAALLKPGLDGAAARAAMRHFYAEAPFRFAGAYRRMVGELLAGHAPLAFNCSAGKDRTGVAAALLLTALGVPHATVMQDYLLSNRTFLPAQRALARRPDAPAFYRQLSPAAFDAVMGVDASYLDAAFAAIRARGGIDAYFRDRLGLDAAGIARLRALYLTPA